MTDASRIFDAADKAASNHYIYEDIGPVVVAVLRELSKYYTDYPLDTAACEVGFDLMGLANEIEGVECPRCGDPHNWCQTVSLDEF